MNIHLYGSKYPIPSLRKNETAKKYIKRTGGDLQQMISKLPDFLPWTKYPGEKHAKGYNYLGPGTRLDIRLDENDMPKEGEEPINGIDKIAYYHDLAYKSTDIKDRNKADQSIYIKMDVCLFVCRQ